MKIYITGISGTGKTTLANALHTKGFKTISIDETPGLCTWVNRNDGSKVHYEGVVDKEFITGHKWVCFREDLRNLMSNDENVFVCGVAENQDEYLDLFDKVILLQCEPEIFLHRLLHRTGNPFGKDKSAQEYLVSTYKEFENNLIKKGAVQINVNRSLDEVIEDIIKCTIIKLK